MTKYSIGTVIKNPEEVLFTIVDKKECPEGHNISTISLLTRRSDHGGWGPNKNYWWVEGSLIGSYYKIVSMEKITLKEFLSDD